MTGASIIELNLKLKEDVVNLVKEFEKATGFSPSIKCEKIGNPANGNRYWVTTADIHIDNKPLYSQP
jgi:hypothetical protein